MNKAQVIAEIGCNHKGDFNIAKELITKAKLCGANVAKFQKRNIRQLLTPEQYDALHPNPENSYGRTYGEHREFLEFDVKQHAELKKYCEKIDIIYSTSVWDEISAYEIIGLNPMFIKVPSACNNNFKLLQILRDNYSGDIHVSTGMTTNNEIEEAIKFFEEKDAARSRVVLYSCTSAYPVPFENICLLEITRLKEKYANRIKSIGFSGHHLGIAVDIAGYILGAEWIERHFTLDRTWKGTDHAASLEPSGLGKLTRDLEAVYKALTYKSKEILDIEEAQRIKLKYRKQ
jgi:sialic acid synthase